eukprot:CAMPEP_0181330462 /NCGR_PEP_ID=MMETSP1101-20121128/23914_1 /TAXON_ID=46948 /ORGANISM="Rhodomonas abbreviata, Strain Caron Lab Isolate" /LENGTH=142 /DNA_ID=CAMNT_0023439723 /DNA_START=413 /DNA_END=841 /DNA_ORIENTATION=-
MPVHAEGGGHHLALRGEIDPELEEAERVGAVLVDEGEHLAVYDASPCRHPLQVPFPVPASVAHTVGMVAQSLSGDSDGFEASMRMLGESRDAVTVVHPVWLRPVEVGAIASPRRLHFGIACWVVVLVVDAEEEGVQGFVGEA